MSYNHTQQRKQLIVTTTHQGNKPHGASCIGRIGKD